MTISGQVALPRGPSASAPLDIQGWTLKFVYTGQLLDVIFEFPPSLAMPDVLIVTVTAINVASSVRTHIARTAFMPASTGSTNFADCTTLRPDQTISEFWYYHSSYDLELRVECPSVQNKVGEPDIAAAASYFLGQRADHSSDNCGRHWD